MNILIIEDDLFLAKKIKDVFEKQILSNRVKINSSYEEFIFELPIILSYDIILVDIILTKVSEKNGVDIIEVIRTKNKSIPIIIMSWLDWLYRLEKCFDLWANDYILKPFRLKELELRIHKWFKIFFYSDLSDNCILSYYDLLFNIKQNEFYFKNILIPLTKRSKYILSLFISNKEQILFEQFLIDKIWWDKYFIIERNLRVSILRLKHILKPFWIDKWINNIRGEGYILKK